MSEKYKSIFEDMVGVKETTPNIRETRTEAYAGGFTSNGYFTDFANTSTTPLISPAWLDTQWTVTPEWDNAVPRSSEELSLSDQPSTITVTELPEYRFDERRYLEEAQSHIDRTYNQHYAQGERQATEEIIDDGYGTGFNMGNIHKYYKRYGKKAGYNRTDLLKIIHYAAMQLYVHDKEKLGD